MPEVIKPLTDLTPGSKGTIREIRLLSTSRPRLMEMGLLVGTPLELIRFAPLSDPIEVKVRGYHLTLRRHEADQIFVAVEDNN